MTREEMIFVLENKTLFSTEYLKSLTTKVEKLMWSMQIVDLNQKEGMGLMGGEL